MIREGYLAEMAIHINPYPYPKLDEVITVTGYDLGINGHWYDEAKHAPVGNFKVGGVVLSQEYNDNDAIWGLGWSGTNPPVMTNNMAAYANFISTIPLIIDGVLQDVSVAKFGVSVTRACERTAVGFEADHKAHIICHEGNMTLPELQAWFQAHNCVIALCVDGGKSSEWATKYDAELAAVDIYNFIFFRFAAAAALQIVDIGLKFTGALTPRAKTDLLVLHHLGMTGDWTVQQIHAAHINSNGWRGIAYHYYVRRDGTIYRGRPENVIGGHTLGYNSTSIGVCVEGNLDVETMPAAQQAAVMALVADIRTRYPGIKIKGHRDLNATSCPGTNYPFAEIAGTDAPTPATEDPDDDVKTFQAWLNARYGSGLVLDGIYGAKTKAAAVKAYQQHVGVKADGVFGPITKAAVRTMGKGSTGTGVYILQGLLYGNGFDPQGFDGRYGPDTRAAVIAYQNRQGLAADGLAGPNTLEKLMK